MVLTTSTFMARRWNSKTLIPEILHAFLEADREFQTWSRSACPSSHSTGAVGASSNGALKAQA